MSDRGSKGAEPAAAERGFVAVARESDIPAGEVAVVDADGRSLCVGHSEDGTWGAIDNVCTHDGGVLGEGELDGCEVECPRHGARFDLTTGEVRALPAVYPVNAYPVRVVDGRVEVKLDVPTRQLEIG
jgi:nitrite reductase/ring-hydroxylating ferredoxin subunit